MAKPIFVAYFRYGVPSEEQQKQIKEVFVDNGFYNDYYVIINYEENSDKGNSFELLTRGRKTKVLTKKLERLLNGKK